MRESDVNWMLAACVQSGAALVAIVGGLLGSRYVALDAEQQAAQRRLKDATIRLQSARKAGTSLREHEDEERAAARHLRAVRQPQAFALALRVLAYIAVTTIGLPLILMIPGPETLPLWVRIGVAAAFMSGVALLLRYLFVYAAVLSPRVERTTMPSGLVGLVLPSDWPAATLGAQEGR